jgi:hypothetical protein
MRQQIAQLSALVMHGNARLDYGHAPASMIGHSTLDHVRSVQFCDAISRGMPIVARDIDQWWTHLDDAGCVYLQLHYYPASKLTVGDRMLAGYVNSGGRWIIEQCNGFKSDYWESNWDPIAGDWNIELGLIQQNDHPQQLNTEPLEPLADELMDCLTRLFDLAHVNKLEAFAERFEQAANCLDDPIPPDMEHYPDLAPPGLLSAECRQLLAALELAWVFDGEHNWNDATLEKRANDYEPLTDHLYRLLVRSLCAVTNSTAIPLARGRR